MNYGNRSNLDVSDEEMRRLSLRVVDAVVTHLATLRDQPAQKSLSRAEAKATIAGPAPENGIPFDEILSFLDTRVFPHHAREPHPHFMGYIPSSPTFPAVLGDWLATGFNFFAGVWSVASGPNEIELVVLDWFRRWLAMPEGTSGLLVSGGSTATLNALVAARHAIDPTGTSIPRLTIYASDQA